MDVNSWLNRDKIEVACILQYECENGNFDNLNRLLDLILNPENGIDSPETIEWCKSLIAAGRSPEQFKTEVKKYDNSTSCGLVWTPNFVAYRCRTCGISPCMSLCKDCFTQGNHETHDYNWFYSQAGGACDCGDASVMRDTGFCAKHGKNNSHNLPKPPARLTLMAENVMPRMIFRLALHFREYSNSNNVLSNTAIVEKAGLLLKLLLSLNDMGALMCNVITKVLTSHELYKSFFHMEADSEYMRDNLRLYNLAIEKSPNPIYVPDNPNNIRVFKQYLDHMTFLEELVFWMVRYEFQQQLVCFLLKILPNSDYKEALIKAFVLHYSRIAVMLGESDEPDLLSNRVVHVSVQLFSNQALAFKMTNDYYLLYVMILSFKHMMSRTLVINRNIHKAVDCSGRIMREHCYWPLVSDLNNIISHKAIAIKFLNDADLLRTWFDVLLMFQGMNLNRRETTEHIEFEPNTYYAAFSAELEVSSYPMWSLVAHLKEEGLQQETKRFIDIGLQTMFKWLSDAGIQTNSAVKDQVTFHLPLHRYFAIFLTYAVRYQKLTLDELLPSKEMMELMFIHPLMIQVAIYEISNGLWVRNGLQIKGQALSYVKSNFSMSMIDADLYLLQVICTKIDPEFLYNFLLSKFNVRHFINLLPYEEESLKAAMFEGMLMFLAILVSIRTYLGSDNCDLTRLEIVGWLSLSNQTYSNLVDLMPERCLPPQCNDFESILAQVADFKEQYVDQSGAMYPSTYTPKNEVWENEYDPIHILLRVPQRKEFQTTLDRFINYCRSSNKLPRSVTPWPPYRIPKSCNSAYEDPRKILQHRFMHAILFVALYKAVHTKQVSEQLLSLIVHFLHMTVDFSEPTLNENRAVCSYVGGLDSKHKVLNLHLDTFYQSDCLFENLRTTINDVVTSGVFGSDLADEMFDDEENEIDDDGDGDDNTYMLIEEPLSSASIENENRLPIDLDDESHMVLRNSPNTIVMLPYPLRADNVELPALPPPIQYPAVLAGNEVGRPVHPSDVIPNDGRIVPSVSAMETSTMRSGRKKKTPMIENELQMNINENMISLLLKCHSNFSGRLDSFQFNDEHHFIDYSASIGDGPYFIGRLLQKIGEKDPICRQFINETRMKLWPEQMDNKQEQLLKETIEKAERKRKALEHQQKTMAEFARNQSRFLERNRMDIDDVENQNEQQTTASLNEQQSEVTQYECAICKKPSYMDDDSNMGLVALMQSSNIIGHQIEKCNQYNSLPITDEDYDTFMNTNMMVDFSKRLANCAVIDDNTVFANDPTAVMLNYSWPSTVHVQTCGHYVHLNCYGRYMRTLISQRRQQHMSVPPVDRKEYVCPVCRQLSNSVLPILSKQDLQNGRFKDKYMDIIIDIARSIKSTVNTKGMADTDENMHLVLDSIYMNDLQPLKRDIVGAHESYLMTCIARSNIEIELIQRGGSLCVQNPHSTSLIPMRNCIRQLCQVLSKCSKIVSHESNCFTNVWASLVGLSVVNYDFVPVLLRDPTSILFQVILNIPVNFNIKYFTIIVRRVYHLLLYQILTQLLFNFSQSERMRLLELTDASDNDHDSYEVSLINHVKWIINKMSKADFISFDNNGSSTIHNNKTIIQIVVEKVQSLSLHFLRIASIFKLHYFKHCLPEIRFEDSEFRQLVSYLDLNFTEYHVNGSGIYDNTMVPIPDMWFNHLFQKFPAGSRKRISAQNVLADFHSLWKQPRLLELPKEYEKVFMFYHEKTCLKCRTIPTDSSICLLCGRIVCFRSACCKVQGISEPVQHSIDCGNGLGIFLVIKSTCIIVVRGLRTCVWGYIYLDIHDEDDHDNKRGKPLYLCYQRYQLLERHWLTHRFDHLKKNWDWHQNAI